jgi:predicted ATPase/DNA-binding winged helix-turn-helix (wHTH) protein
MVPEGVFRPGQQRELMPGAASVDAESPAVSYSFGRVEVQIPQRQVLVDGQPVPLGARAFDVLMALIERRARLVTKDELLEAVWPGLVVEEHNVVVQVGSLRRLLGPQVIATVPGRGYRFVAPLPCDATLHSAMPDPAPAGSATPLPTNLPDAFPTLFGRDEDLAALRVLVQQHRIVTITGAGGIGKSRVAQQFLHERRGSYPQGVCWVELAALSDPSALAPTIARAMGLQLGGGDPLVALASALKRLTMLIALDNAEHLVEHVARGVQVMHEHAAGVCFLITSQVPLKLDEEQVVALEPLAVPAEVLPPERAMGFGAVELFVRRAKAVDRHFQLVESNVAAVTDICRQLDGLPLAIELAAARAPLLGVGALRAALDDRLRLLAASERVSLPRQQTLRATLEYSHGLLSASEQMVLRRLAAFVGGFLLTTAQQVSAEPDQGLDEWGVLDVLGVLVDRSMMSVELTEPPRYRLLESMRVFALERLMESGEEATIRQRHARAVHRHFEDLYAQREAGRLNGTAAQALLAPDLDNARAAMEWALARDPALAVALVPSLSFALGFISFAVVRPYWDATADMLSDQMPPAARAAWMLGWCAFWSDRDPARVEQWAPAARDLCCELGNLDGACRAQALLLVAVTRSSSGKTPDAVLAHLQRLAPSARRSRGTVHLALGMAAVVDGRLDDAIAEYQQAWVWSERCGEDVTGRFALSNLADALLTVDRTDEAIACCEQSLAQTRGTRRTLEPCMALTNLCAALLTSGDTTRARAAAEEAWPLAAAAGILPYLSDHTALLAALEGRLHDAAQLLGYGDARYKERNLARVANEARAAAQAEGLARAGLGAGAFEGERSDGTRLDDTGALRRVLGPGLSQQGGAAAEIC